MKATFSRKYDLIYHELERFSKLASVSRFDRASLKSHTKPTWIDFLEKYAFGPSIAVDPNTTALEPKPQTQTNTIQNTALRAPSPSATQSQTVTSDQQTSTPPTIPQTPPQGTPPQGTLPQKAQQTPTSNRQSTQSGQAPGQVAPQQDGSLELTISDTGTENKYQISYTFPGFDPSQPIELIPELKQLNKELLDKNSPASREFRTKYLHYSQIGREIVKNNGQIDLNKLREYDPLLADSFAWINEVRQGKINPYDDPGRSKQYLGKLWEFGAYNYATKGFSIQDGNTVVQRYMSLYNKALDDNRLTFEDLNLIYNNFTDSLGLDKFAPTTAQSFMEWIQSPNTSPLQKVGLLLGVPMVAIGLVSMLWHGASLENVLLTLLGGVGVYLGWTGFQSGRDAYRQQRAKSLGIPQEQLGLPKPAPTAYASADVSRFKISDLRNMAKSLEEINTTEQFEQVKPTLRTLVSEANGIIKTIEGLLGIGEQSNNSIFSKGLRMLAKSRGLDEGKINELKRYIGSLSSAVETNNLQAAKDALNGLLTLYAETVKSLGPGIDPESYTLGDVKSMISRYTGQQQ